MQQYTSNKCECGGKFKLFATHILHQFNKVTKIYVCSICRKEVEKRKGY